MMSRSNPNTDRSGRGWTGLPLIGRIAGVPARCPPALSKKNHPASARPADQRRATGAISDRHAAKQRRGGASSTSGAQPVRFNARKDRGTLTMLTQGSKLLDRPVNFPPGRTSSTGRASTGLRLNKHVELHHVSQRVRGPLSAWIDAQPMTRKHGVLHQMGVI